jgi:hypothetical protein
MKIVGENQELTPEIMAEATELTQKLATLCREYQPHTVLFVLEAALGAEIGRYAPPLSDLFDAMMGEFKSRATMLLTVAEIIKAKADADGTPIEDVIRQMQEAQREAESKEPASTSQE